jgi:hypothetical protein
MSLTALKGVEHPLVRELRAGPPVPVPTQLRSLLAYGRQCGWSFEWAWRWSFEAIRWPHCTEERRQWKQILGECYDDESRLPAQQREMWHRAYDRMEYGNRERGGGRLLIAAPPQPEFKLLSTSRPRPAARTLPSAEGVLIPFRWHKSGSGSRYDRISALPAGAIFLDRGGTRWTVERPGPPPVVACERGRFAADGKLRGRLVAA